MRARQELLERLACRRKAQLGAMSDEAFEELRIAVKDNPDAFVDTDEDRAFSIVASALATHDQARKGEEFLDDAAYEKARATRLDRLASSCDKALTLDPQCLDAAVLGILARATEPNTALDELADLDLSLGELAGHNEGDPDGCWADVFLRPRLRLKATTARFCLETTRAAGARRQCDELVSLCPSDQLGARYTWALACARLEDEDGLNELDAKFGRVGNAWMHLARTLLMFKLDRMPAARRALRGYASLCPGGTYALLRPTFVEAYLPDRPEFKPGTFEEAVLAAHEADPVIVDVPDFIAWATAQDGISDQARDFAAKHDLDW